MREKSDKLNRASTMLATMLDYLGLNSVVKVEEKNGKEVLVTYSEETGRIIGKKGQSLQSLELLVNRIINKNDNDASWISIDVDGYSTSSPSPRLRKEDRSFQRRNDRPFRQRRERYSDKPQHHYRSNESDEENLQQMALDAAKEVKRWGEPVTLKPMNAHDRRIIHVTLQDDSEIKSESFSEHEDDKLKSIVISLKEEKK